MSVWYYRPYTRSYMSYWRKFVFETILNKIACGVLKGSITVPSLIYANDFKQALPWDLLIYPNELYLLNEKHNFSNLCKLFFDNRFSVHFGEDKPKSILCGIKHKLWKVSQLHIKYQELIHHYLGRILNEAKSSKPMA